MKLHLGCGENYLDGYTNIDLPGDNQQVMKARADIYQDIRTLSYQESSVDEIRNHHLLEHFTRQESLKLLMQWRRWLKPGGILFVETPDFETAAIRFFRSGIGGKFKIARHIFGSHEADWAVHKDWWGEQKFRFILPKLGFESIIIQKKKSFTSKNYPDRLVGFLGRVFPGSSDVLDNIIVRAKKSSQPIDFKKVAKEILSMSLIGKEKKILDVWLEQAQNP
ncbi:TPA: hypothetical protein DEX28_00955 [Patescibacteria group bacterium]|nr:hypothetical protein [Patescibacteria group bacterium]